MLMEIQQEKARYEDLLLSILPARSSIASTTANR